MDLAKVAPEQLKSETSQPSVTAPPTISTSLANQERDTPDSAAGNGPESRREPSNTEPLSPLLSEKRVRSNSNLMYYEKQTRRTMIRDFCEDPGYSKRALVFHTCFAIFICLSILTFIMQTYNLAGTQDEGNLTPDEFNILEAIFTVVFVIDITIRFGVADVQCCCNRKPYHEGTPMALDVLFWLDIASVLPFPMELIAVGVGLGDYTDLLSFFNLFRICRIFKITRRFDGTKVLVITLYRSYEAIVIQILFLFTMCLTFGFLLFYMEPCLGNNINAMDNSCEFPDLLQSTYFLLITITTVGYGDQIPMSTGGRTLAVTVAILGSFYMAMPLSIIGSKFEEAYQERELYKLQRKTGSDFTVAVKTEMDKSNPSQLYGRMTRLLLKVHTNLRILAKGRVASAAHGGHNMVIKSTKLEISRLVSDLKKVYKVEEKKYAPKNNIMMKRLAQRVTSNLKVEPTPPSEGVDLSKVAKHVVLKQDYATQTFRFEQKAKLSWSIRDKLWLCFEVPNSSMKATWFNNFKMFIIFFSLMVLSIQSQSQYNDYGEDSRMCHQVINSYCNLLDENNAEHVAKSPACFARKVGSVEYPGCRSLDTTSYTQCGFPNPQLGMTCSANRTKWPMFDDDFFYKKFGKIPICAREQCNENLPHAVDNSRVWLTIEAFTAVLFFIEMCVRIAIMRTPEHFFLNYTNILDMITAFVCVIEVIYVPLTWGSPKFEIWGNGLLTDPATIRFTRIAVFLRFISMQRHFVGMKVIYKTFIKVYKKIAIPLMFFFIFVLLFAGMYFTFEKGSLYQCANDASGNPGYTESLCTKCLASTHNLLDGTCALRIKTAFNSKEFLDPYIHNMGDAIWTICITMTTVGFGGKYPITFGGQIVAIMAAVFGAFYMSMPLTIWGGAFYDIFTQEWSQVQKHRLSSSSLDYATSSSKPYVGKFSMRFVVKLKMWARRATRKLRAGDLTSEEKVMVQKYLQLCTSMVTTKFHDLDLANMDIPEAALVSRFMKQHMDMMDLHSHHLVTQHAKWIHPTERTLYVVE